MLAPGSPYRLTDGQRGGRLSGLLTDHCPTDLRRSPQKAMLARCSLEVRKKKLAEFLRNPPFVTHCIMPRVDCVEYAYGSRIVSTDRMGVVILFTIRSDFPYNLHNGSYGIESLCSDAARGAQLLQSPPPPLHFNTWEGSVF
ncbi:unnamed protein product, partial [Iphiclides podalirius]